MSSTGWLLVKERTVQQQLVRVFFVLFRTDGFSTENVKEHEKISALGLV